MVTKTNGGSEAGSEATGVTTGRNRRGASGNQAGTEAGPRPAVDALDCEQLRRSTPKAGLPARWSENAGAPSRHPFARAALLTMTLSLSFALLGAPSIALAGSPVGSVAGSVRRPDPARRPEVPVRNQGFVPRIRNQMIPPRPYDPLPYVVVVLEPQNSLDADDKAPPKTASRYELIGESFRTPLFPVTVKGTFEIRNFGSEAHRLTAPAMPGLIPADPINPKGVRSAKLERAYEPVVIRDPDKPHLRGTLVAFPLRYFSQVDDNGDYTIENVPTGRWKVRIWYKDGWLKVPPVTIDVGPRRTAVKTINFPANPQVDVPGAGGGEE